MKKWASLPALFVIALAALVWRTPPAFAISCPSSTATDFASDAWFPGDGDVSGIRAPINLRTDGSVCSGGPELGFAADWIAIENTARTSITQIGWIHIYDPNLGSGKYCEFWAIDGGTVHEYNCGVYANFAIVWFKITKGTSSYNILDCGYIGGYSSCTTKNATQPIYSSAFGVVSAETDYGASGCIVHIMGSTSDYQFVGNSGSYPIEGKHDSGPWETKSFSGTGPVCSDYRQTARSTYMLTADSRNS